MSDDTTSTSTAQALKLCLAGDRAGLALYREHATAKAFRHGAIAETLRALVVAGGGDIATRAAIAPETAPETIAQEYEALFARGLVNSRMVDRYARALTHCGRTAEVAALFDVPRRLYSTVAGDADAVATQDRMFLGDRRSREGVEQGAHEDPVRGARHHRP